jgi:hypothetical protein
VTRTVEALKERLQGQGYSFAPFEDKTGFWVSDCPLCAQEGTGARHLRIWEYSPGAAASLACSSGCRPREILGHLGWDWNGLDDAAGPDRPRLRALDVEHMRTTEPPPVPWVVKPFVARGVVTMVVGREGTGKSLFALGLASGVGRGDAVAGFACEQGKVLVIDAENGEAEAHRRLSGLDVSRDTLSYYEADEFDLREHLPQLEALLVEHRPTVVVLDSMRSLTPGLEENDSGPTEKALAPLRGLSRRYDCAVLVLHHTGKATNTYRGSTAIGGAVELGFTISDSGDDGHRTLTPWKCRIAERPPPLAFSIVERKGRAWIAAAQPRSTSEPAPSLESELARKFATIVTEHGELPWGELCLLADADPGSGSSRRARSDAIMRGTLAQVRRGVYGPGSRPTDRPTSIEETVGRSNPDGNGKAGV